MPNSPKTSKRNKVQNDQRIGLTMPLQRVLSFTGKKKEAIKETNSIKLQIIRRNIAHLLHYGNVTPFQWNTKGFKCFYCNKDLYQSDLIEHTNHKHADQDLEAFLQKIVSKHLPVKIDVSNLGCKVCTLSLPNMEELVEHIRLIHEVDYATDVGIYFFPFSLKPYAMNCVLCDDVYDNFSRMMSHMNRAHMEHGVVCQICGQSFIDQPRLQRHITCAHVGYKCKYCDKYFSANHKLDKHKQLIHGHTKTYNCKLCSGKFDNDYQVKVHMGKDHNVEKYRIKCDLCPKICNTKGAMVLHMQCNHAEVVYQCDMCDYKSGIKWLITLHKRKHFGEQDYQCSLCSRKFGRSSNLKVHMKVHTGQVGNVCGLCRQGFTDVAALKEHKNSEHLDHYM